MFGYLLPTGIFLAFVAVALFHINRLPASFGLRRLLDKQLTRYYNRDFVTDEDWYEAENVLQKFYLLLKCISVEHQLSTQAAEEQVKKLQQRVKQLETQLAEVRETTAQEKRGLIRAIKTLRTEKEILSKRVLVMTTSNLLGQHLVDRLLAAKDGADRLRRKHPSVLAKNQPRGDKGKFVASK